MQSRSQAITAKDALSYVLIAVVVLIAVSAYVALRFKMNREYSGANWASLVELRAPRPFGHRVLVPLFARSVASIWTTSTAFIVAETVAVLALLGGLWYALRTWVASRPACLLAAGFLFVLPYAYLLRFKWPIFYPWDTPSMAAIAWGAGLAARRQHVAALVLIAVAATNRETALIVPLVYVLLHAGNRDKRGATLGWAAAMVGVWVMVRMGILWVFADSPGRSVRLMLNRDYRVFSNLRWLAKPSNLLAFLGGLGLLPMAWALVSRWVPRELGRLHVLVLALLGGLLITANAYEPRAFGELLVLAYIAVAVGAWKWATHERAQPARPEPPRWLGLFDRFGGVLVVALWILAMVVLRNWPYLPRW